MSPALAGRFFITSATSLNLVHSKCFSILPSLEDGTQLGAKHLLNLLWKGPGVFPSLQGCAL